MLGCNGKQNSPAQGQHRRRQSEGDDIGQGIKLPSKIAGGVGDARNSSIQRVQKSSESERSGGKRKMRVRSVIARRDLKCTFKGLQQSYKAKKNIAACEQRRKRIGRPARSLARPRLRDPDFFPQKTSAESAGRAKTLLPPATRSPTLTTGIHSGPKNTSTREPNLI